MKKRTKLRIWSVFTEADKIMLHTPAQPMDLSTLDNPDTQQLIDDLIKTMKQADGIGLAAPQIGQSLRLAIVAGEVNGQKEPFILVNPVITVSGAKQIEGEEGCLSIPGVFGLVPRAEKITFKAFDRFGQPWSTQATELFARVIQHEVDHLNGVLFLQRLTSYTKGQEKIS